MSFPLSLSHHHKKKSEQRNWHKIVFALCKLATFFFVCAFFLLKNLFVVVSCVDGSLIIDGKSYGTILKMEHIERKRNKIESEKSTNCLSLKSSQKFKAQKIFYCPSNVMQSAWNFHTHRDASEYVATNFHVFIYYNLRSTTLSLNSTHIAMRIESTLTEIN